MISIERQNLGISEAQALLQLLDLTWEVPIPLSASSVIWSLTTFNISQNFNWSTAGAQPWFWLERSWGRVKAGTGPTEELEKPKILTVQGLACRWIYEPSKEARRWVILKNEVGTWSKTTPNTIKLSNLGRFWDPGKRVSWKNTRIRNEKLGLCRQ